MEDPYRGVATTVSNVGLEYLLSTVRLYAEFHIHLSIILPAEGIEYSYEY